MSGFSQRTGVSQEMDQRSDLFAPDCMVLRVAMATRATRCFSSSTGSACSGLSGPGTCTQGEWGESQRERKEFSAMIVSLTLSHSLTLLLPRAVPAAECRQQSCGRPPVQQSWQVCLLLRCWPHAGSAPPQPLAESKPPWTFRGEKIQKKNGNSHHLPVFHSFSFTHQDISVRGFVHAENSQKKNPQRRDYWRNKADARMPICVSTMSATSACERGTPRRKLRLISAEHTFDRQPKKPNGSIC